jgi:hypothetical protein
MNATCSGEPISFLRLERYLQGDVQPSERAQLETHLAECGVCRECFEALRNETTELLPLAVHVTPVMRSETTELPQFPEHFWRAQERRALRTRIARAWPQLLAATLTAAAAMLLVRLRTAELEPALSAQRVRIKGGELAIELVREHAATIATDPKQFAQGDRFQVKVSCPPGEPRYWDVVVFQAGELFFPLKPEVPLQCRNGLTLPGAFMLDGYAPASVCVIVAERHVDRALLSRHDLRSAGSSACVELKPTGR